METTQILIKRRFSLMGMVASYPVRLNGKVVDEIKNGQSITIEVFEGMHEISIAHAKSIEFNTNSDRGKTLLVYNNPVAIVLSLALFLILVLDSVFNFGFLLNTVFVYTYLGILILMTLYFLTIGKSKQILLKKKSGS